MARFGLVGGAYQSRSVSADAQTCINVYVEMMESTDSKSSKVLYGAPGLKTFCDLNANSVRGGLNINGRVFFVAANKLYELFADKTFIARAAVAEDDQIVSLAASQNELLIVSAGHAYWYELDTNLSGEILNLTGVPFKCGFADGFFIILLKDTKAFQISELMDAQTWLASEKAEVSEFPGNVVTMIVDHRELFLPGNAQSIFYQNTGNFDFPIEPIPGGFIESGCIAPHSIAKLDNTVFWLGGDERGAGQVWRAAGYLPTRVSTSAIEDEIQNYTRMDDAIAYTYQFGGHGFYVLYFPTANKTWVFDVSSGLWHQRGRWRGDIGQYEAHHSQCHVYAFGKHLVGDWGSGKVYEMSNAYLTDDNQPIRWARRAPYISNEAGFIYFHALQIDMEMGRGPMPPLTGGTPSGPPNFALADETGAPWYVSIDDNGIIQTAPAPVGTATDVLYLNDYETGRYTQQIMIDAMGVLSTRNVIENPGIDRLLMLATTGFRQCGLYIAYDVASKVGVLSTLPVTDVPRDPMICMRYSDDGAHTWSNDRFASVGQAGKYKTRAIFRRMGRSRGRVYEISGADPVPIAIIDAYLDATPGYTTTERLASQLRKGA